MSPFTSTLPFPIFTCRSPSGEICLKPKKTDYLPQLLVRKIQVIINFYAVTGEAQCKTYVNTVMIPFSDRPALNYFWVAQWRALFRERVLTSFLTYHLNAIRTVTIGALIFMMFNIMLR